MFLFEHLLLHTGTTSEGGGGVEEGGGRYRGHGGEIGEAAPGEGVTRGREVEAGYGQVSGGAKME